MRSSTFDERKRNNGIIAACGLYGTSFKLAALAKQQLYDEVCPSHPGLVPDNISPEDVIKDIQTAQYEADKIGISAEPSKFNRDLLCVGYSLFGTFLDSQHTRY